ncbi:MAG: transketolase [Chitinophagia bacterium]|nr:transketolase [Chitinophagia bacterium]
MDISYFEKKALQIRRTVLQTAIWGGKGHIPPAFSWADIAAVLFYGNILQIDSKNPKWINRDRFILSKGHACLTLYAVLSDLGFFSTNELKHFAGNGSLLPGHPDIEIPGVEVCTGSLGHGLSVAAGMATAAKLDCQSWFTYVILGDGECHEGSVWEAAMYSGHQKLGRLIAIVDRNMLGATDFTENYASLGSMALKFNTFGWETVEVDGHNFDELLRVLSANRKRSVSEKPLCIIAHTTKGKGVSFMENSKFWHHQMPKGDQIDLAWELLGGVPEND